MPCYNAERYIAQSIESVLAQTYTNWELLITDDCSSDNSYEIANTFVNNHKGAVRFVLLHNELNKGLSAARNIGIQYATGDFVFFLDSDDYLLPDCLFQMTSVLKDNPDVDYIEGRFYSPKDNKVYPIRMGYQTIRNRIDLLKHFYAGRLSHVAWNKLIRRQIIISNSLFFADSGAIALYETVTVSSTSIRAIFQVIVLFSLLYTPLLLILASSTLTNLGTLVVMILFPDETSPLFTTSILYSKLLSFDALYFARPFTVFVIFNVTVPS